MQSLKLLRQELDDLDDQILSLFARRYRIRDKVMPLKIDIGMALVAPDRVQEILARMENRARELDIPPEFATALYTLVLDYSHRYEEEFRRRIKA